MLDVVALKGCEHPFSTIANLMKWEVLASKGLRLLEFGFPGSLVYIDGGGSKPSEAESGRLEEYLMYLLRIKFSSSLVKPISGFPICVSWR